MEKDVCENGHEGYSASQGAPCAECETGILAAGAVISNSEMVMQLSSGEIMILLPDGKRVIYTLKPTDAAILEALKRTYGETDG